MPAAAGVAPKNSPMAFCRFRANIDVPRNSLRDLTALAMPLDAEPSPLSQGSAPSV